MIALYDKVLGGPVFLDHGVDPACVMHWSIAVVIVINMLFNRMLALTYLQQFE